MQDQSVARRGSSFESLKPAAELNTPSSKHSIELLPLPNAQQTAAQRDHGANIIKTTRYTNVPWSTDFFLWKALFEQFQRRANLYFVLIAAIQVIPGVSPTGRFTTLGTLIVVLLFSMARSFVEDGLRYFQDRKQNQRVATVLNPEAGAWVEVPVTTIFPGMIVRVTTEGEGISRMFPCDCLLLTCSNPTGECLLETSTLDGETNFKTRLCAWQVPQVRSFTAKKCGEEYRGMRLAIDEPNADLLMCNGHLVQEGDGGHVAREVATSVLNMAFRGCSLKRTGWAVGLAVYTGKETKVMKSRRPPRGVVRSSVERKVNWLLVVVLLVLLVLCTICVVGSYIWVDRAFYLGLDTAHARAHKEEVADGLFRFLTFLVLFNNFIPISLYVSLEIIKLLQGIMMALDLCMYSHKEDQRCVVRSSELNEELGQITHMFCDKTGTLTQNKMSFRKFAAGAKIFGRGKSNTEHAASLSQLGGRATFFADREDPLFVFFDERIPDPLDCSGLPEATEVRRLFMAFALCHTVLTNGDKLEAEFPDEEALVHAAQRFGIRFVSTRNGVIVLEWGSTGIYSHFEVLQVIPFTPQRKRMTVVVKEISASVAVSQISDPEANTQCASVNDPLQLMVESVNTQLGALGIGNFIDEDSQTVPEGHVLVITKGASSTVSQRLAPTANRKAALQAEETLASQGLRTLIVAQKLMPAEEFYRWQQEYGAAPTSTSLSDEFAEQKHRTAGIPVAEVEAPPAPLTTQKSLDENSAVPEAHSSRTIFERIGEFTSMNFCADASGSSASSSAVQRAGGERSHRVALENALESNLELLGTSALEDKLQCNVMQTLSNLRAAGIKIWMMTGDHTSTARKIALACGLMSPGDPVTLLSEATVTSASQLAASLRQPIEASYTLQITGEVFSIVFEENHDDLRAGMFELFNGAASVICSRFSPKQKLQAVELLKEFECGARTLGIGDGANDVPMIEACDVGIGMFGNEGHQAVDAADYAVAEFEFVHRLLLVHGRANYVRICKVINYFFYKNAMLVSTQFWYCLFNYFSGESLYEGLTFALFNVLFTSLPCIVLGIFDRDVLSTDRIHQYPQLYRFGIEGRGLNLFLFTRWILEGICSSVAVFFVVIAASSPGLLSDGFVIEEAEAGLIIYTVIIVLTTARIAIEMRSWTTIHVFSLVSSLALGWIFYFVYGEMESVAGSMYKLSLNIGFKVQVWLIGINATMVSLIPTLVVIYTLVRLLPPRFLSLTMLIALKDVSRIDAATRLPIELAGRTGEDDEVRCQLATLASSQQHGKQSFKELFVVHDEKSVAEEIPVSFFSPFEDSQLEANFNEKLVGDLARYRYGALICFFGAAVITIAYFVIDVSVSEQIAWGVFSATALGTFAAFHYARRLLQSYYHSLLLVLCFIGFSCVSIANLKASQADPDTHPVTLSILMMGLITVTRPPLFHACQYMFIGLLAYGAWYQAFRVREWLVKDMTLRFLEVIVIAGISLLRLAIREYFLRAVFVADWSASRVLERIEEEENRSYLLLKSVLPSKIVHAVQKYGLGLSLFNYAFAEGSYLQSDIVMFTKFSSAHESTVVIEMLNRMFTKFDGLSHELGVEKIKTIGDAYIAAAGIPSPDTFHAQRIILLGLGLSEKMREMNAEGLSTLRVLDLHVRVGVASGPLVGGVVGKTKVAYDVFGEAKNLAEHLEQTGLPDRVQCTEEMANALADTFTFEVIPDADGLPRHFIKHCVNLDHLRGILGESAVASPLWHRPVSVSPRNRGRRSSGLLANPLRIQHRGGSNEVTVSTGGTAASGDHCPAAAPHFQQPAVEDLGCSDDNSGFFTAISMTPIRSPSPVPLLPQGLSVEQLGNLCPHEELIPHLPPGIRSETYDFFDDDNEQRVAFVEAWKDFEGDQARLSMRFLNGDAEQQFQEEIERLAVQRTFHDMLLGAAFFALTAIISILAFVGEQEHPFVLALFALSILHFIAATVIEFAATQRESSAPEQVRRWQKGSWAISANPNSRKTVITALIKRIFLVISSASAIAALATSIAFPFVFNNPQSATITVFVTIAATSHAFAFMFFRNLPKIVVLLLHLCVTVAVIVAKEYHRWDSGTAGDIFGIFIAYCLIAIDIVDFEQQIRNNFVVSRKLQLREAGIESAVALSEKLLENVLPPVVITKLRTQPDRQVVDVFASASAMFVYSNVMDIDLDAQSADGAIQALNEVVFMFDTICRDSGAEKIKTSPYLIVCGLPMPRPDHAPVLVVCAMKILTAVEEYNAKRPRKLLEVKIGINTGKISAGVLGKTKFQYDAFGDTLNVASRLAAFAPYGSVMMSDETRSALQESVTGITLIDHGATELKGKGLVHIHELDTVASAALTLKEGTLDQDSFIGNMGDRSENPFGTREETIVVEEDF